MIAAHAHHAAHGGNGFLVLAILAVAALGLFSLYRYPFGPCPKCKGRGVNRGSNRKRFGECPRCRGRRQVQRFGSRTVHRVAWTIRGEMARSRAAKRDKRAGERSEHPRRLIDKD